MNAMSELQTELRSDEMLLALIEEARLADGSFMPSPQVLWHHLKGCFRAIERLEELHFKNQRLLREVNVKLALLNSREAMFEARCNHRHYNEQND
jgi:hypothetical protein